MIDDGDRTSFGYVVRVEGRQVTLNVHDTHRGHQVSHADGITSVTEYGSLFAIDGGARAFVMRVTAVHFAEPAEIHRQQVMRPSTREPLRHVRALVMGTLERRGSDVIFDGAAADSPVLGAEGYPLSDDDYAAVLKSSDQNSLSLGRAVRGGAELTVPVSDLLGRHVAVLGSTGSGKSCLTAAVLQQLSRYPEARIVVFDLNNEYEQALGEHFKGERLAITELGRGGPHSYRIPYYALGRHGLGRLLVPSEKMQRPALNFALDGLRCVKMVGEGATHVASDEPVLFDDCRPGPIDKAVKVLDMMRAKTLRKGTVWPHMKALGILVAESQAIQPGKTARDAWSYGNVAPLVTRIQRRSEDDAFAEVVAVEGGAGVAVPLDWAAESRAVVDRFFGTTETKWNVHLVKLNRVANDLLPYVLGSLLELFAHELFLRGQDATHPTLLVLEEAHNYLRELPDDESGQKQLSYERLAKEGRKYGVSLWLSTQRPSEVSPTVLSQCGTWCVFRVTGEIDRRAVASAGEWPDRGDVDQVAALPRRHALVFGPGISIPTRVIAAPANPVPKSMDPPFRKWARGSMKSSPER